VRRLEQELRIPELSELLPEGESAFSQSGSEAVASGAGGDISGSLVESLYRRQKRQEDIHAADTIEQIRRLSELHKSGILTEKEFNEKKKELLSRI
jgi:hypothetical protein